MRSRVRPLTLAELKLQLMDADMVADMEADMEVDMVADMEVDMVADIDIMRWSRVG